jgi:hypothetical protein
MTYRKSVWAIKCVFFLFTNFIWKIFCSFEYCHVSGVPCLIITGSGLDDWIYWCCYYKYTQLQPLTTVHNRWLPKACSISLQDYWRLLFHCSFYESYPLSYESSSVIHSRPLGLVWPLFITFREPCRKHRLEGFRYCCLCMHCAGNVFSSMVTEPVV